MALPGTGKTFDQFETDDATCRHFALGQAGGAGANETAANTALGGAAVGTALGAAAGAAFNGGAGAAVGAGAGLLAGSAFGTAAARGSIYNAQRRYDHAYLQCMYANGERVPVRAGMMSTPSMGTSPLPPPPPGALPPPTGVVKFRLRPGPSLKIRRRACFAATRPRPR